MANLNERNVFGEPILVGDRKKRAMDAFHNQTAGDKLGQAREYLANQQKLSKAEVCTIGLFYNATGETLVYRKCNDRSWDGSVFGDGYPQRVENGQWGAFLHVGTNCHSSGFVIYDGYNNDINRSSQLIAWGNPQKPSENHAYCKICNEGDIDPDNVIKQNLEDSNLEKRAHGNGMYTLVQITNGISADYKATLTRDEVVNSVMRDAASQQDANASSAT